MEIKGKLITKLAETSGTSKAGKDWVKQEFIIETQENYPKKICIQVTKESLCTLVNNLRIGYDYVTAHVNIESRVYNGRWYTQINAWKIELNGSTQQSTGTHETSGLPPF